eukprot:359252-Chlamydomonas_euryale.AAC.11
MLLRGPPPAPCRAMHNVVEGPAPDPVSCDACAQHCTRYGLASETCCLHARACASDEPTEGVYIAGTSGMEHWHFEPVLRHPLLARQGGGGDDAPSDVWLRHMPGRWRKTKRTALMCQVGCCSGMCVLNDTAFFRPDTLADKPRSQAVAVCRAHQDCHTA